ncbi:MAG: hypothetical protein QOJ11_4629 [Frankiales bacterium]|nr:hypothetical protein [Frankiales bacterium]
MTSTHGSPARRRLALAATASVLAVGCGASHQATVVAGTTAAPSPSAAAASAPRARTTTAAPRTSTAAPPPSSAPAPRTPSGTPITLAFGGDVHFMGVDALRLAADPVTAIGPIAKVLTGADLAMVNLETAVTTRGTRALKQFTFRAPPAAFTALKAAGIDVVTMANNHGEDYGQVGLADTLAAADAADFPVVGIGADEDAAFAPYGVTVKGDKVAIIGATQVLDNNLAATWTAGPDKPGLASANNVPRLLDAVRAARATADTVVVYLHWGKELASCPTSSQRTLAQRLVDAGADIVVGSHAHVQLGAGRLGGAFVDYGLGNFVFYAHGVSATTRSGVLLLTVAGRAVTAARWVPAQIEGGVPQPLTGEAATRGLEQWDSLRPCTGLGPIG